MPPAGVIVSKAVIPEIMAGVSMAPVVVSDARMMGRAVRMSAVPTVPVSTVSPAMSAVSTTPLGEARRGREERQCDNHRSRSQET
jgi:hypothetical protein